MKGYFNEYKSKIGYLLLGVGSVGLLFLMVFRFSNPELTEMQVFLKKTPLIILSAASLVSGIRLME